ncbi:MAG: hypothetical protein LC708_01165 [Actinobacteria bacterium]|nr:hypothetical protein [Actinomycetota bacterium]
MSAAIGAVPVTSASTSAQLAPAQVQRPAQTLALTGFDIRWMLLLAALAMALGALVVRLADSMTPLPITERTAR